MLSGRNERNTQKGYLYQGKYYRGKPRERPTLFATQGEEYEMVNVFNTWNETYMDGILESRRLLVQRPPLLVHARL